MTHVPEVGAHVTWTYGSGLSAGRASGEVLETGVEKFGHDDIIIVDSPTDPADETYIRPDDLVR